MGNGDRKRTGEILFIDAGEIGYMRDKTHREFSNEDVSKIAGTYHEWRQRNSKYEDIKGFCKSAKTEEIQKNNFVLTQGRYVGIPDEVDDGIPFETKMNAYLAELKEQFAREQTLNAEIKKQLAKVGFRLE
jgi:type I restriction enzyme M protein